MKIAASIALTALISLAAWAVPAQAVNHEALEYWNSYDPVIPEQGEFTSEYPIMSRIATAPIRALTTVGGTVYGAVAGAGKGIAYCEGVVMENTIDNVPPDNGALMYPAAVVGGALALPAGAAYGIVRGAAQGAVSGFMYPEGF